MDAFDLLCNFADSSCFISTSFTQSVHTVSFDWFMSGLGKDAIYTKLTLMPWIDDNLGHTLSGLTKIGNIIAKIYLNFTISQALYRFPL